MQAVWHMAEDASPNYTISKDPVYHHWFAEPRGFNIENSKCPYPIPFYLSLNSEFSAHALELRFLELP